MPKLSKAVAKEVQATKAWSGEGGRSLLPEGRYAGRLAKVVEYPAKSKTQFDTWRWEFRHLHDEEGTESRGQQSSFTSLSPKARGNLTAHFNALGFTADSDTDEMVGEWAVLFIVQEIAERGKNEGKMVNRVAGVSEFVADDWDFEPDSIPEDADEDEAKPEADDSF